MFNSSRFVINATVSVAQTFISGLILFILYRYLIIHLGAQQLGLWSVVLAGTAVGRLSDMGLTGSVVKFVARYRAMNEEGHAAEAVQTAAISIAIVMAVFLLAIYPFWDSVLALAIPAASMAPAMEILPWAVFSLWLSCIGGIFQSGLDGCQRMDLRNILLMLGNGFFLGATCWLVPRYGLIGLAIGQAMQGLLLIVGYWLLLRRQMPSLPWIPFFWSKSKFKEMFGYAVNFQITSVAIMLVDPATKMLMSRYGGLSSAAFYEMASQMVVKLRAMLIAANQALVPTVAEMHETAPEKVRDVYLKAYRMMFFVVVPFYATILISLPLVSQLWIGHREDQFLFFGAVLTLGWGVNTLNVPAYFISLGTGDLKWNTISHVSMALLNFPLCLLLGKMFGGAGVAIGAMMALVCGSAVLLYPIHRHYKISFRQSVPWEHYSLLGAAVGSMAFALLINRSYVSRSNYLAAGLVELGTYFILMGGVAWFHPYRGALSQLITDRWAKK